MKIKEKKEDAKKISTGSVGDILKFCFVGNMA